MDDAGGRILSPFQPGNYVVGLNYTPRVPRMKNVRNNPFGSLGITAQGVKIASSAVAGTAGAVTAASAIAAGAAAGSVVPGIGTAVGALVGITASLLAAKPNTAGHIGSWDTQLVQALARLPATVAGIGRQIPWNEDSHGLTQMIEALLATQVYMAWDPSLVSSYDVCAHWAMTFAAAVQATVTAVCKNPAGKTVSATITNAPGGSGGNYSFTFVNPGYSVGPEAVSAQVIMGTKGLMYAMMIHQGVPQSQANQNANNSAAQKVYALMADYVIAANAPAAATQPATPVPPIKAIVPAASAAAKSTVQPIAVVPAALVEPEPARWSAQPVTGGAIAQRVTAQQPPIASTSTGQQVTSSDIANLIAALQAQGATNAQAQAAAAQTLQSQGVNTNVPAVQAALTTPPSVGIPMWMLLAGGGLAAYLLFK